jgi:acyl-CoA thioester hydrolase
LNTHPDKHAAEFSLARVVIEIPVAWGEMDALGHVNNVVYFRYLESARIEYIRRAGFGGARESGAAVGPGLDGAGSGIGFILQHVSCRFRRPVTFPDTLRVSSRCIEVGSDRFTLSHAILSVKLNKVVAIGQGTIVCYDYAKRDKIAVPRELHAAIQEIEC